MQETLGKHFSLFIYCLKYQKAIFYSDYFHSSANSFGVLLLLTQSGEISPYALCYGQWLCAVLQVPQNIYCYRSCYLHRTWDLDVEMLG